MKPMKVYLIHDGKHLKLDVHETYAHVIDTDCPKCGAKVFAIQGTGKRPSQDDRAYEADGISVCCKKFVGIIRAEVNTLFGVREDEMVLNGRVRVY